MRWLPDAAVAVTAADGFTYERKQIEDWLVRHGAGDGEEGEEEDDDDGGSFRSTSDRSDTSREESEGSGSPSDEDAYEGEEGEVLSLDLP